MNPLRWMLPLALILGMIAIGLLWGPVSLKSIQADLYYNLLWNIRFPRLMTAALVGAALALAGATFQGMLQNPLADPYVLGVSSGAGFGACLGLLWGMESQWGITICASIGSAITILGVTLLARKGRGGVVHFILAGMMLNAFFAALNLLLLVMAQAQFRGMMMWLMGDLGHTSGPILIAVGGISLIISLVLVRLSPQINAIAMGDEVAQNLGIHVAQIRIVIFILASTLTGMAVALGGVIGFVGLVIPHCIRWIRGDDFRIVLPLSALWGAVFLMGADWGARMILSGTEIPVGVVTALFGAPFFLILFLREGR